MLIFFAIIIALIVVISICFCCMKEVQDPAEPIVAKALKEFKKKVKAGGFETEAH
jgi:hypothetical protein